MPPSSSSTNHSRSRSLDLTASTTASTTLSSSSSRTVTPAAASSHRRKSSLWSFSMPFSNRFRKGSADTASTVLSTDSSMLNGGARKDSAATASTTATTLSIGDDIDDGKLHPPRSSLSSGPRNGSRRSVAFSIPDSDDDDDGRDELTVPAANAPRKESHASTASSTSRTPTVQLVTTFAPTNIYHIQPIPLFPRSPVAVRAITSLVPPPHLPGPLPPQSEINAAPVVFQISSNTLTEPTDLDSAPSSTRRKSSLSSSSSHAPPRASWKIPWSLQKPAILTVPHPKKSPTMELYTDVFDKRGLQWVDACGLGVTLDGQCRMAGLPDDEREARFACRRTRQQGEWVVQKEMTGTGRYVVAVVRREKKGWVVWVDERGLDGVVAVAMAAVLAGRERQRRRVGGGTI